MLKTIILALLYSNNISSDTNPLSAWLESIPVATRQPPPPEDTGMYSRVYWFR